MLNFHVNEMKCVQCGLCVTDCPMQIIDLDTGLPRIIAEKEAHCLRCQHCVAICPHQALSILGQVPAESVDLIKEFPDPNRLETLIKGRRSVRQFTDENLDPALVKRLLNVAWHAPTGVNLNGVQFTVIDDKEKLSTFREETYTRLAELVEANQLPENRAIFAKFVKLWQGKQIDILFRNAPHLVVTSAPQKYSTPVADGIIALSYFELFAQNLGVGTLWDGLLKWAIDELVPDLKLSLGIPESHVIGYVMIFGKPAVKYRRIIEKGPVNVVTYAS